MLFHYIASQPDEKIVENDLEAETVAQILSFLSSQGLRPISIQPIESKGIASLRIFGRKVTLTDQIFISKYMALMLKIGTGLLEAINILIADFQKPAVKDILINIRASLEQGAPFYSTFARYPKIFSPVYINLIRAGESSGTLEKTFDQLTQILTKHKDLRDQIRGALVYPVMLLVGSVVILAFIVTFALPKIANVFMDGGLEPPTFSRIVFNVGLFFNEHGLIFLIAAFAVLAGGAWGMRSSLVVQRFVSTMIGEIPILRDVVKKMALQRFASVFSSLISAGIPITDGLEITAQAVSHPDLKVGLVRISREGLAKGLTIGEAFRREPFFPLTVVSLIAISEKAGHLGEVLETLSDFYTKEIDASVKTLVSFLEPILLLGIGAIIGVIALAIIVPIYQLTTQF